MEASSSAQAGRRGARKGATEESRTASGVALPRYSAAKVRREIVRVLAPDKAMTPAEIQQAVTLKLPTAEHASIKSQIRVLRDGDYLGATDHNSRKLALTESGRRWSDGIEALAVGD